MKSKEQKNVENIGKEEGVTSYMIDFKDFKNPLLKDRMYHILDNELCGEPYMAGLPKHFPLLKCAIEVVLPSTDTEKHLKAFIRHIYEEYGIVADTNDCFPPDYFNEEYDEEKHQKFLIDCEPFVLEPTLWQKLIRRIRYLSN